MRIIDGTMLARNVRQQVQNDINEIIEGGGTVNFTAVIVGENPSSRIYVNRKKKACDEVGINMTVIELGADISQGDLDKKLRCLSEDKNVHAILLQLPLPNGLSARSAISNIDTLKDVDGLTIENFGNLTAEKPYLVPCTAKGVVYALEQSGISVSGKDICVIGRSEIVGKPLSLLLMSMDATVTVCHKLTKDLKKHTLPADIVIVAAGCPKLVTGDMVKKNAVVIDIGINRLEDGKIVGDADFESVSKKVSAITPVPGGIGPLTIAFLLQNVVQAWKTINS